MIFDIALGIFLFLSPVFINIFRSDTLAMLQFYQFGFLGNDNSIAQLQFFQYGIVALFLTAMCSKPQRIFKDDYAAILFFAFLLSIFLHPLGVKNFVTVFLGFLLYYLAVVYTKSPKRVLMAVVIIAVLNTVFAVLQYFKINLLYSPTGRSDGLMCLSSHLGVYQALAMPVCYSAHPLLLFIPLAGLLLSKSFLAIAVSLVAFGFIHRKRLISFVGKHGSVGFMLLLSLIAFLTIRYFGLLVYKLSVRFSVWLHTIKLILERWHSGYGLVNFNFKYPMGLAKQHYSVYLQAGYIFGVFGIVLLFFLLKDKFYHYENNTKTGQAVFLSCLILALAGAGLSFMDFPRLAGTAIVLFASLTIMKGDENGNDKVAV